MAHFLVIGESVHDAKVWLDKKFAPSEYRIVSSPEQLYGLERGTEVYITPRFWNHPRYWEIMNVALAKTFKLIEEKPKRTS